MFSTKSGIYEEKRTPREQLVYRHLATSFLMFVLYGFLDVFSRRNRDEEFYSIFLNTGVLWLQNFLFITSFEQL